MSPRRNRVPDDDEACVPNRAQAPGGGSGEDAVSRWLTRSGDVASSLVLLALVVMTCIDVVGRYFFNAPLDGATELTQIMLGIIVFATLPSVGTREEHVSVDLIDLWYPERWVMPRQFLLNLIMAALMAMVTWRVWIIAGFMVEYGDTTEFLAIPYAPITYFIAIMSGFAALTFATLAWRYLRGRGPAAHEYDLAV